MTFKMFKEKCEDLIDKLEHKIRTSDTPSKMNESLQGDFILHLFLSAGNMKKFKYDFFLRKFALNINEEFMDSLSMID